MELRNMTIYSIFVRNHGGNFAAVEKDIPRIRALGAEPVTYAMRNECCGGYTTLENAGYAAKQAQKVLDDAACHGAELLITACPLCMYNLTRNTNRVVPVKYFTELLFEALGLEEDNG